MSIRIDIDVMFELFESIERIKTFFIEISSNVMLHRQKHRQIERLPMKTVVIQIKYRLIINIIKRNRCIYRKRKRLIVDYLHYRKKRFSLCKVSSCL